MQGPHLRSVTAEHPDANALRIKRTPTVSVTGKCIGVPMCATGCDRSAPTTIVASMLTMNTTVGTISALADSAIPNMFSAVRITSPMRLTSSR